MASYEETLESISLDAHDDLAVDTRPPYVDKPSPADTGAGFQYRFVTVSGDHEVNLLDGTDSGAIAVGVLQNKPQIEGMAATVGIDGISLVECGGEIDAGDSVGADATGRAVSGGGYGIAIYGGTEGQLIPVLLRLTTEAVPA